jgi:hypothetical protein
MGTLGRERLLLAQRRCKLAAQRVVFAALVQLLHGEPGPRGIGSTLFGGVEWCGAARGGWLRQVMMPRLVLF